MSTESRKRKKKFTLWAGISVAFLGGVGVGLQNTLGVFDLLKLTGIGLSTAIPLAIFTGGLCCTIVNFSLNTDLLSNFWDRITKKPAPILSTTLKIQYWLGIFVFILTGSLFGMAAFSIAASSGGLLNLDAFAIIGITAGLFVSLISIPQELETWLASFEHPILTELGKAIDEIKEIDTKEGLTNITALKQDILYELYETLSGKIGAHIKQVKRFHSRPHLMQTKLTELQTWFAGVPSFECINNDIQGIISALRNRNTQVLTDEALNEQFDTLQKKINLLLSDQIKNSLSSLETIETLKKDIEEQIKKEQAARSVLSSLANWLKNLSFGKLVGLILSLANTMALSLMLTIGLTTFLSYVGVPALPALITGFSVAFTAGAYSEFYFYHYFLSDFCDQIQEKWKDLMERPNPLLGIFVVAINAGVTGAIAYFCVQILEHLFVAAGVSVPSLLPLAWVSAVSSGVASFLLGSSFWIDTAERFAQWAGIGSSPVKEKSEKQDEATRKEFFSPPDQSEEKTLRTPDIFANVSESNTNSDSKLNLNNPGRTEKLVKNLELF
jgi:hypothetical protein